jgi:hypothetical protein
MVGDPVWSILQAGAGLTQSFGIRDGLCLLTFLPADLVFKEFCGR